MEALLLMSLYTTNIFCFKTDVSPGDQLQRIAEWLESNIKDHPHRHEWKMIRHAKYPNTVASRGLQFLHPNNLPPTRFETNNKQNLRSGTCNHPNISIQKPTMAAKGFSEHNAIHNAGSIRYWTDPMMMQPSLIKWKV